MNGDISIQLKNLTVGYRRKGDAKVIAEGLNASLRTGEMTCLLGENGVGKSTLLRTLSAFLPPLSGEIVIAGRPLDRYSVRELSRIIGVVLTDKSDLGNMTVSELVGLGRSPYTDFWGRLTAEDRRLVNESIEAVGITSLKERAIGTLSDGERQKAMIAKALAQQTPVIFLDEPTAFLDYPSKVEIMQLLHDITRKTRRMVFLSTHDMEFALQMADCIWLMKRNEPLRTGTPEDLSLDGTLSGFFTRQGIAFDRSAGLFRIEHRYECGVELTGNGLMADMADKALRRNGIDPQAADAKIKISADENGIRICCEEDETQCQTIGEMLDILHRTGVNLP